MAKNSLAANVAATINAIKDIKNALIERGTEINADTHILSYGNLIRNMKSGSDITSNIIVTANKNDILGTTEHNKLCILSDTGDLSFKVVDKIEGGSEEISVLSEVLPKEIQSACCATYRDKIYIFGGTTVGSNYLSTIYKFNCKNKTIETLNVTLPTVLSIFCCTIYEDNIYIFGGFSGLWLDTIFKFNCTTETIVQLSVTLPLKIVGSRCVTYRDKTYIFGGINNSNNFLDTVYKLNITTGVISTLSVKLPKTIGYACCSIHNDNVYIFGGFDGTNSLNTIFKFNCTAETIVQLSTELPEKNNGICSNIYNDNIYIFGGDYKTIFKFNCTTETIETLSESVPKKIKNSCCSIHNGNIYIFGGFDGTNYDNTIYQFTIFFELINNNVLIYNANSNYSFDLITDQVTIPIKKVYIGDSNNTAKLANAYLYDEAKSAWVNVNTCEVLS